MSSIAGRSCRFRRALCRAPAESVAHGLRAGGGPDPDPAAFRAEHAAYVAALEAAGLEVRVLPALEAFPDSVFVEDAALCPAGAAVLLRPGAPSRRGEAEAIRPALEALHDVVVALPGEGLVDGGDVLLADEKALVGISERTDAEGARALATVLAELGYRTRVVETPPGVLHFKTDCALLDPETIFATRRLAASGCFSGYEVIEAPEGEEAAANLIRVNDRVLLSAGHPRTADRLDRAGYRVEVLRTVQAARLDGGLSCLSLRIP